MKGANNKPDLAQMPTRLAIRFLPAFQSTRTGVENRAARLKAKANVISIPRSGGLGSRTADRCRVRVAYSDKLQGEIELENLNGQTDLMSILWASFARLDTDVLLTLIGMLKLAVDSGKGYLLENINAIARQRGWEPESLDKAKVRHERTRRKRLKEAIELLTSIEFTFSSTDREEDIVKLPMFTYLGSVENTRVGSKHRIISFNPILFQEMIEKGRSLHYDPSILLADPSKDEWAVKIYLYVSARWAACWVSQDLAFQGGRSRHKLGTVLRRAGIESNYLQRRQPTRLRRRVSEELQKLVDWKSSPLIGGFEIEEHDNDPEQDIIIVWPPERVAEALTSCRSKSSKLLETRRREKKRKTRKAHEESTESPNKD